MLCILAEIQRKYKGNGAKEISACAFGGAEDPKATLGQAGQAKLGPTTIRGAIVREAIFWKTLPDYEA